MKYENPPVRYVVAKLKFSKVFGKYSEEKYKKLLSSLNELDIERIVVSDIKHVQLNNQHGQFEMTEGTTNRVAFFSPNGRRCGIISEREIEFRLAEYDNHTRFLDHAYKFYSKFKETGFAVDNPVTELSLHYVDHFIPDNCDLKDMFAGVSLPKRQFYQKDSDFICAGVMSQTRILESKREKVVVSLEQLEIPPQNGNDAQELPKVIPDALVEPDEKMGMPIEVRLPVSSVGKDYAIVHTFCSKLVSKDEVQEIRESLESLYKESRVTFDNMINSDLCNKIWSAKD